MMSSQDKLTSHFQPRKKAKTSTPKATRSATAAAKQESQQLTKQPSGPHTDDHLDEQERVLRAFDLSSKYGPCTGMTRMQRWERAQKFGLSPPQEVRDILEQLSAEDAANNNIWHNRV